MYLSGSPTDIQFEIVSFSAATIRNSEELQTETYTAFIQIDTPYNSSLSVTDTYVVNFNQELRGDL